MSIILALHARIEAAWDDFYRIDQARTAASGDRSVLRYSQLNDGAAANQYECDALSAALLFQVPTTDEEARVLAQHLWCHSDMLNEGSRIPKYMKRALDAAMTSLFAYLAGQGPLSIQLGGKYDRDAALATKRTNYRTGKVEVEA